MTVADISFLEVARGPWTDLQFTVTILDDQNAPVAGATITGLLFREGRQWTLSATTDSNGQATWQLQSALVGTEYCVRVDGVSHSHTYDPTLSPEYDPIVGKVQDCHTVGT